MRSLFSQYSKRLAALVVALGTVGVLVSTTGVLASTTSLSLGTSAACGCEASAFNDEGEDETTKEKDKGNVVNISPVQKQFNILWISFTWLKEVLVKNSKLVAKHGTLWTEGAQCAVGLWKPGELCITLATIECLAAGEALEATQLIEYELQTGGGPKQALVSYVGKCLS